MKIKKPNRVCHSYVQHLHAAPEVVFPLLCPVLEEEWVPGWSPEFVLSDSGAAEEECVFVTPGDPASSIWIINRHEPERHYVEMYKVTPAVTVGKLRIQLSDTADGETAAEVSYEYTALSDEGDQFIEAFTKDAYNTFMQDWETALNAYLSRL
ncbi:MAG: hypothetical protein JXX29_05400 [Deltaproteobacteria bacterium]|nr:hypothetical protein [Deltaproteobacteria bacterium]MBN2671084.1 hypothetical protein [Deltaproteobacteria bacterium]